MKVHKIKVRDRTVSCDDLELVQGTQGVDAVGSTSTRNGRGSRSR